jgi:stage IV sporulation protein FB
VSARAHLRIAGIPVHVQPVFFVIAGLFGFRYIDFGLDVVLVWIACTFVSILVHELGHGLSLKLFGQPSAIVLHGFGGVTISPRRASVTKARSIIVSLAGSATAMVVLWLPTRQLLAGDALYEQPRLLIFAVYFLSFQNLWWSVANLLPIRPLDGGNVTAELFGMHTARRVSIAAAIGGAVWAFLNNQGYGAFFLLFLAFNNWQEMKAEQRGSEVDVFEVDAPDVSGGPGRGRGGGRRRRGNLRSVPAGPGAGLAGAPTLSAGDPARDEQQAWAALRAGDAATAQRMAARAGSAASPFLSASVALVTGDPSAFERFEAAYVAQPSGPPSLVATELLARSGAASAVAKRLVARPDGKGREGAATLQTHLHYGDRFREAAEVGEAVYEAAPASRAQTAFEVACSWARADEVDRAVTWLEHAAEAGFRAAGLVDGEPDLAVVRTDPRWPLLRARLA